MSLFKKISDDILQSLSKSKLSELEATADSTFNRFDEILTFSLEEGSAKARRDHLIRSLDQSYDQVLDALLPIISFSIAETTDFGKLEDRGRAAIQLIRDDNENSKKLISETLDEAKRLLEEVRKVASEEGVTKQAIFFKDEAEKHDNASLKWLRALISLGLVLLGYTLWTLFNSQSDLFKAESGYGSVQIAVSKFLVFSVLAYGVLACAKNYQSHRHNSVVNKHRQNALMTFRTFTESGGTLDARDTILNHAAAAIYAPVDSGYVRNEERGYGSSMPSMTLGGRSIPGSAAE